MKSIIQSEKECLFTKSTIGLEEHHIYGGANRKLSERYGLKVWLTHDFHNERPYGAHHNRGTDLYLKRLGQKAFMARYPELDFVKIFGRNYLD